MNKTYFGNKHVYIFEKHNLQFRETRSVTMNIFRKKNLFKSFVKIELSYVFT